MSAKSGHSRWRTLIIPPALTPRESNKLTEKEYAQGGTDMCFNSGTGEIVKAPIGLLRKPTIMRDDGVRLSNFYHNVDSSRSDARQKNQT